MPLLISNTYTGTASKIADRYWFDRIQTGLTIKNNDTVNKIIVYVNDDEKTLAPQETFVFDEEFEYFHVKTKRGTALFTATTSGSLTTQKADTANKLQGYINIREFGELGTVAKNTSTIQTAFNSGYDIRMHQGSYEIDGVVISRAGFKLMCEGNAKLVASNNCAKVLDIPASSVRCENLSIRSNKADADYLTNTAVGINITGSNCEFSNLTLYNLADGIYFHDAWDCRIAGLNIGRMRWTGIRNIASGLNVSVFQIQMCENGFNLQEGGGNITNGRVYLCTGDAVWVKNAMAWTISDVDVQENAKNGLVLENCKSSTFDIQFLGNGDSNGDYHDIVLKGNTRGNQIKGQVTCSNAYFNGYGTKSAIRYADEKPRNNDININVLHNSPHANSKNVAKLIHASDYFNDTNVVKDCSHINDSPFNSLVINGKTMASSLLAINPLTDITTDVFTAKVATTQLVSLNIADSVLNVTIANPNSMVLLNETYSTQDSISLVLSTSANITDTAKKNAFINAKAVYVEYDIEFDRDDLCTIMMFNTTYKDGASATQNDNNKSGLFLENDTLVNGKKVTHVKTTIDLMANRTSFLSNSTFALYFLFRRIKTMVGASTVVKISNLKMYFE